MKYISFTSLFLVQPKIDFYFRRIRAVIMVKIFAVVLVTGIVLHYRYCWCNSVNNVPTHVYVMVLIMVLVLPIGESTL